MLVVLLAMTTNLLIAQDKRDVEIRKLENEEKEAVMRNDSALLLNSFWSSTMVVNSPANRVGTIEGTKMQLRTGKLDYLSFERNIENITFNDNLAIVMGEEKIKPKIGQDYAGKLVPRRFTNIWK